VGLNYLILDQYCFDCLFYYKIVSPKNGRDRNVYPVPEYIGACASIETDVEIANYHLNNIKTGFAVGTIVNFNNGVPEQSAQDQIERMLPWERNIFMDMMKNYIEKQNEAMRK
jgi:hypothetical protein